MDEVDDCGPEAQAFDDAVDDRLQGGGQVGAGVQPQDQSLEVAQGGQAEVADRNSTSVPR
jgi:hypothetical protein